MTPVQRSLARPGRVALERALSKLGHASRREARALIAAGRVAVDGRVVTDPLHEVVPERAVVAVDGQPVVRRARRVIALYKPRGVVTTRRDPQGRRTVFDLLGDAAAGLVAVGRLDLASAGLLLLTNDTRLADWLTDPANAIPRRYVVTVRGALTDDDGRRLVGGVDARPATGIAGRLRPARRTREPRASDDTAADGVERLGASVVQILKRSRRETHLVVTLTEGRNREIRRMCEAVGHEVTRLLRVGFGGIELGELKPGECREITDTELARACPRVPLGVANADLERQLSALSASEPETSEPQAER